MNNLLSVGFDKGEMDFAINGEVQYLTPEIMQEFRAMTMVAIGVAEETWRRYQAMVVNPASAAKEIKSTPPTV